MRVPVTIHCERFTYYTFFFDMTTTEQLPMDEIRTGRNWIGLGVAGNQAGHLGQAGEDSDFAQVQADENAPKGLFPWFIPQAETVFGTNPLSSHELTLLNETRLQPEPEVGLIVEFDYHAAGEAQLVQGLRVLGFGAFNDCSRRIEAPKISHKKNWGEASQGLSEQIIPITDFSTAGGTLDQYRLVSYLLRDGDLIQYGEDTPVSNYCYFNTQLTDWLVQQINTQQAMGPLEDIRTVMAESRPHYGIIGIGATCYTDFGNGEERFLRTNDEVIVALYPAHTTSLTELEQHIHTNSQAPTSDIITLRQRVV